MAENESTSDADEPIAASPETEAEPIAESAEESDPAAPAAAARLILKRADGETEIEFAFDPPAVIGRFDPEVGPIDVDLGEIDEGRHVSRKHARIEFADGAWTLHDLGSSNGTFVLRTDFERIEEAEISDGDEIAFGNARFVFRVS